MRRSGPTDAGLPARYSIYSVLRTHQHTKLVQVWPDRIKTFPPASPILSKKHSANPVRLRLSVFGVGVPTGTCVEIIESLNRKINAALADPACCHFPEAAVRLG